VPSYVILPITHFAFKLMRTSLLKSSGRIQRNSPSSKSFYFFIQTTRCLSHLPRKGASLKLFLELPSLIRPPLTTKPSERWLLLSPSTTPRPDLLLFPLNSTLSQSFRLSFAIESGSSASQTGMSSAYS
jgi:hypothetical protein